MNDYPVAVEAVFVAPPAILLPCDVVKAFEQVIHPAERAIDMRAACSADGRTRFEAGDVDQLVGIGEQ